MKHTGNNRYIDLNRAPKFSASEAKEQNIIGRRIAEARRARGMTLGDLSDQLARYDIHVIRSAISRWELGQNIPSSYILLALCCIFEIEDPVLYFSGRSVFTDEGLQKIADYKSDLLATGRYSVNPPLSPAEKITMKISSLRVSAGTGSLLDDENFEEYEVSKSAVPDGAEFGIYVSGDSMEPVFRNGQVVWVRQCQTLSPGEVGIFLYDGDGYIKVYGEKEPSDPESYTDSYGVLHMQPVMISYNKNYRDIEVSPEKTFQIVGKVLSLH